MRNLQQMLSDKDEESMRRQSHLEQKLQEMEEMRKNIKSMDYFVHILSILHPCP